MHSQERDNKSE